MKVIFIASFFILLLSCAIKKEQEFIPEYTPFSTAVIKLQVENLSTDTLHVSISTNTNIPRDGSFSKNTAILKPGVYHLTLELDRPCVSRLHLNDSTFNIMTIPGDTTFISSAFSNQGVDLTFEGRWESIGEYLYKKQRSLHYYDISLPLNKEVTSYSTYKDILFKTDSITNKEFIFFEEYSKNHQLPSWYANYEQAEITYAGAGFKMGVHYANKAFNLFNDQLPTNYYHFLSSVKIDNPEAILSASYYWFLDDYFIKDIPESFFKLGGIDRAKTAYRFIHSKSRVELSEPIKSVYNQYQFYAIATITTDRSLLDSLVLEFEVPQPIIYDKLLSRKSNEGETFRNLQAGDEVIDFFVTDERDSLISIRQFSDKIIYLNFWATWCKPCIENIPELNKMILSYSNNDKIAFINICMDSDKETWAKKVLKENMKGHNFFAEGNWSKKLKKEFNIPGMPTYVLLKPGNKLEENNTGKAPAVKAKIDQLLAKEHFN